MKKEQQWHYYPKLFLSSVIRHGRFSVKLKIEFSEQRQKTADFKITLFGNFTRR